MIKESSDNVRGLPAALSEKVDTAVVLLYSYMVPIGAVAGHRVSLVLVRRLSHSSLSREQRALLPGTDITRTNKTVVKQPAY